MFIKENPSILVIPEGKICDYIDETFRNDTPEEYVRQNIEKRLINEHKYKREQIKIEQTIKIGTRKPRVDIAVYPENCENKVQENIEIIIECKKEGTEPHNKKEGVDQLKSYMAACSNCKWGMWTNGVQKEVFRKVITESGVIEFQEYNDIPSIDGSIAEIDRPTRKNLKNAVEDNLLFTFKTCHNHIYITDGMQKQPAFFELLKVIFCKIEDERNFPEPLEFYATSSERGNPDGQLTVKKRISKIFSKVKKKYGKIFDINDEIKLQPRSLAYIVSELQKYSLLNTNIDIKGKAYEELVGANLRGDRGEFFTPRNVMKMTVEMLEPQMHEKILDPTCGTGGFLVNAMIYIIEDLQNKLEDDFGKPKENWDHNEILYFQNKISEIAANNFYGFDLNPDLVKATKMNMVMNNDGSGNILQANTLLPPHEWSEEFRVKLAEALKISKSLIRNSKTIEFFDVIVSNPPFGSKIPIKDPTILEQFDLARIWVNKNGVWEMTERLQSSVPPEQLFIERCMQLLKPNGRIGIVLPDSILGSPGLGYIRQWIITNAKLVASIDLHVDTFQPKNGTQTSVLIFQKKSNETLLKEERAGVIPDYNIFMAMVDKIGHDKRGTPIFKRDKYGNEILTNTDSKITSLDLTSSGNKTVKTQAKEKIIDDQTLIVPSIFQKWKKEEGINW